MLNLIRLEVLCFLNADTFSLHHAMSGISLKLIIGKKKLFLNAQPLSTPCNGYDIKMVATPMTTPASQYFHLWWKGQKPACLITLPNISLSLCRWQCATMLFIPFRPMFFAITFDSTNNKKIQCIGLLLSNVVFSIGYKPKKGYKQTRQKAFYVDILVT